MEDIESWLRKLEKSRSKNFSKQLYDSIKEYTEKSYYFDYYQIQNNEFFHQLKPRVRHRLITTLFGNFITNFFYLFNDAEFEGGTEFTSDFLSNLYSRLYLPENEIVTYGDTFEEMVMIQEGVVLLYLKLGELPSQQFEFFVLPTLSYFGDYQILYDLKSQIQYKSGENKLLITLCLSREKLLDMMEDYPEARKFYMERAWQRRVEFRRRQKKFLLELYGKEDIMFNEENDQSPKKVSNQSDNSQNEGENTYFSSDDSGDDQANSGGPDSKKEKRKALKIRE